MNVQAAQAGPLPALQVISTTAETVIFSPENATIPLIITLPPSTANEQTKLDLVASGYITTKTTTNITLKVYSGTSLTVGSDTLLGSSGAIAQNSTTKSWWAHAQLIYDSVSGELAGTITFYVNRTLVAVVTLSNFVTGISNTANPVASFLLSITSSGATAPNPTTINVAKFSVG